MVNLTQNPQDNYTVMYYYLNYLNPVSAGNVIYVLHNYIYGLRAS